jgi:hypothetical protein
MLTCAVVVDMRQMRFGVKPNCLITRIVTSHVTFSAINTKILAIKLTRLIRIQRAF